MCGAENKCFRSGCLPTGKTPPGSSCAAPAPRTQCRNFSHHWRLQYLYRSGHAAKIWRPLAAPWFFSHKLTDTESRYSTFDRELLAAQAAIKHFRHFNEGYVFKLWTDHKPLVTALSRVSLPISPRQQHHLAFTVYLSSMYSFCISQVWKML